MQIFTVKQYANGCLDGINISKICFMEIKDSVRLTVTCFYMNKGKGSKHNYVIFLKLLQVYLHVECISLME